VLGTPAARQRSKKKKIGRAIAVWEDAIARPNSDGLYWIRYAARTAIRKKSCQTFSQQY